MAESDQRAVPGDYEKVPRLLSCCNYLLDSIANIKDKIKSRPPKIERSTVYTVLSHENDAEATIPPYGGEVNTLPYAVYYHPSRVTSI